MEKEYNLIDLYLKDIQKYELLNREEEYELFKRIKDDDSQDARHELILSNLRLVISIAKKSEVKTGKAYLRSSISGKSKDYSIEIEKVFFHEKNSLKTLKIRVTDSELITLTGGIIQGLSGSPILQNGKLVGAVTHVLIDNPQMGYGIFAESMLE